MTLNYLIIGKRIKEARKKKRLSQAQLCEIVGLSDGYVSYIETAVKSVSLDAFADDKVVKCHIFDLLKNIFLNIIPHRL